jgi:hypothetical protein
MTENTYTPSIVLELREAVNEILKRHIAMDKENKDYQSLVKQTNELVLHKLDEMQRRMKAMEYILGLEISDGR